ncbi:MAG TPA: ArgE/DapE family deacylase [Baekduia sp.]|uniref:ArgE/DapE family deacylase n=1 Tax=Baekduia sp. TaxID=2600305 RepID=UPI002D782329|nr:ArgE/DapE family deacylase [Baekduia sp.]HET6505373.1 ArgE/DapE family deacylase [Baekduia sp.]
MTGAADVAEVADLTSRMVAIDSVNPDLVPGAAGESEMAAFVSDRLRDAGLEVMVLEPVPGRPSVVGIARGRGGGRSLMLNAHLDTVGVAGMTDPHTPVVDGDRLYGRGAYDPKGSLAACMLAAARCRADDLRGDVIVAAVADEEYASLGTRTVLEHVRADYAIVAEQTGLGQVCVAHKGFAWMKVTTRGRAAHGSRADLGVDAIAHMGHVLTELGDLGERLSDRRHPLLGPATVHASLIAGGQELSSYPAGCTLELERRTLPGESRARVEDELRQLVDRCRLRLPDFEATVETSLWRTPFESSAESPIVAAVRRAAEARTGTRPEPFGKAGWMDSALLADAGTPAVVFGPGGDGAHALVEWVDLRDVAACADIYHEVARAICR